MVRWGGGCALMYCRVSWPTARSLQVGVGVERRWVFLGRRLAAMVGRNARTQVHAVSSVHVHSCSHHTRTRTHARSAMTSSSCFRKRELQRKQNLCINLTSKTTDEWCKFVRLHCASYCISSMKNYASITECYLCLFDCLTGSLQSIADA